jgi:predicted CXXCH cytochrome family protein
MNQASQPTPGPAAVPPAEHLSPSGRRFTRLHFLRVWLVRALAVLAAMGFMVLIMIGCAGWYTSRPQFCRSCHIMEPYFQSWHASSHRGVACIECHFSPGFGGKIRGKMQGLVQLTKYITNSAGTRPSAEVSDASCLRSGCHETRLLSGKVNFHGIPFDHAPHLLQERRGKQLRCTSCHNQMVQGTHMTVTTSTCFLCHFKDNPFNQGLGACTHCHQIPDKKFDLGGGVTFTHDLAYQRGVDCSNCHADLIRGKGDVPRERCLVCHNRAGDLAQINNHEFMHQKHVTEHNIDCLMCHLEIQHSLDRNKIAHAAADCVSCHPDHHQEQVNMLRGVGAKTIPAHPMEMLAVRLACRTCHRVTTTSATGTVLEKASAQVCVMCHDPSITGKIELYETQLKTSVKTLEEAIQRIRAAIKSPKVKPERAAAIAEELTKFQDDLNFLRVANGIHNVHYADTLTATMTERLQVLCRELQVEEPKAVPLQKL